MFMAIWACCIPKEIKFKVEFDDGNEWHVGRIKTKTKLLCAHLQLCT